MLDRLAGDLLDFTEPADLQRWFAPVRDTVTVAL